LKFKVDVTTYVFASLHDIKVC